MTEYPPVTVYTQPGCRPCKRVIAKLEAAGIDFEVVDISTNEDAYTYVKNVLRAGSVPVIVTDARPPVIGYDPTELNAIINRYRGLESPESEGSSAASRKEN